MSLSTLATVSAVVGGSLVLVAVAVAVLAFTRRDAVVAILGAATSAGLVAIGVSAAVIGQAVLELGTAT